MPTASRRSVRQRANSTLIALIAVLASACSPIVQAQLRSGTVSPAPPTPTERQIITSVNRFRSAYGQRTLIVHPSLQTKARAWAEWMAGGGCGRDARGIPYICHSSLPSGITVHWSRLEENVGDASPRTAITTITTRFEHSPEHTANMLNAQISYLGVGVAYFANFVYVAEEFMAS
jgi:uncharacterized protein YkwD